MENDLLEITEEFFLENKNHLQKINSQRKKGGPYSKHQKDKRREEVYRLHFDYGYSARKIADLMKVNRNTINGDIDYWYSKIIKNNNVFNPEFAIIVSLQRFEIQRSRLREQLDKTGHFQEKLALERLMYDIDSKISYTNNKLCESIQKVWDLSINHLNKWMKANKKTDRYLTLFDQMSVSDKANEKINKIINEDKLRGRHL